MYAVTKNNKVLDNVSYVIAEETYYCQIRSERAIKVYSLSIAPTENWFLSIEEIKNRNNGKGCQVRNKFKV